MCVRNSFCLVTFGYISIYHLHAAKRSSCYIRCLTSTFNFFLATFPSLIKWPPTRSCIFSFLWKAIVVLLTHCRMQNTNTHKLINLFFYIVTFLYYSISRDLFNVFSWHFTQIFLVILMGKENLKNYAVLLFGGRMFWEPFWESSLFLQNSPMFVHGVMPRYCCGYSSSHKMKKVLRHNAFILGQFFLFWTHFGCLFMSWVSQYFLMIFCTERFCVFIRILNKILCWVFLYLGHFGVFWIHFGVWSSKNRENHPIYMNFYMLPFFSGKFSKSSCCNWSWPRCDE